MYRKTEGSVLKTDYGLCVCRCVRVCGGGGWGGVSLLKATDTQKC